MRKFRKIVLIDDDPTINLLNGMVIQQAQLADEVVKLLSAMEALDYFKNIGLDMAPDLILLDLNMPVMNGWEFLERYKELKPANTRVFILTSSIDPLDQKRAEEISEVSGFISKPLTRENLQNILN